MKGYFTFVLHSHLPYVLNHGSWPHGMDWIYEAAAETYIPLLMEMDRLTEKGIQPNITLGITPVLTEQLASERFQNGFEEYLQQKIDAARANALDFKEEDREHLAYLAEYWTDFYSTIKHEFDVTYNRDIVGAFARMQDQGVIEIITCGATHGYFPLLGTDESIAAQVRTGKEAYRRHFGKEPKGIWLPECAYRPAYLWSSPIKEYPKTFQRKGIEEILYENNIQYFIVDSHLIKGGEARGVYIDRFESLKQLWRQFSEQWKPKDELPRSLFRNYIVSSTGTTRAAAVYGRHDKSALQVWSGEWGYPGDGNYLDFHKKHFPGGHRYWRVTNPKADLADKQEYHPEWVEEIIDNQATHFVNLIKNYITENYEETGERGILTAPFDTELFGHWWFEGTRWIGKVLEKIHSDPDVKTITLGKHLQNNPPEEVISIPEGSWGQGGFHYIWLNEWTQWTWKHVYRAEDEMIALTEKYKNTRDIIIERILNQMARELLLLESSDWQFLISTWSARDYAENRLSTHAKFFDELKSILNSYTENQELSPIQEKRLVKIEEVDLIFPDVDFRSWQKTAPDKEQK